MPKITIEPNTHFDQDALDHIHLQEGEEVFVTTDAFGMKKCSVMLRLINKPGKVKYKESYVRFFTSGVEIELRLNQPKVFVSRKDF